VSASLEPVSPDIKEYSREPQRGSIPKPRVSEAPPWEREASFFTRTLVGVPCFVLCNSYRVGTTGGLLFSGWLRDPVAIKGFRKIPCWVWLGCMAGILEDIPVVLLLDAAPERVRSEPRKGRSPRFFSILWPTNAPYGAHYERGEASRPIPKPLNATAARPRALIWNAFSVLFTSPRGVANLLSHRIVPVDTRKVKLL